MTDNDQLQLLEVIPAAVFDHVVSCDPRYQHHLPDGSFVIEDEECGSRTFSLREYLNEHDVELFEIFFASIDMLRDKVTGQVSKHEIAVGLTQLRWLFELYKTEQEQAKRALYNYARALLDDGPLEGDE
jgi:hypothetical protein